MASDITKASVKATNKGVLMSGFIVIVVLLWVSGVLVASGSLIGLAYHPEERARPPEPEIKGRYKSPRKPNQAC